MLLGDVSAVAAAVEVTSRLDAAPFAPARGRRALRMRPTPPALTGLKAVERREEAPPPKAEDEEQPAPEVDDAPVVEALVVRRTLRARTDSGEVYVESGTTSWITTDAVRTSKELVGIVPSIDFPDHLRRT